ncbi:protein SOSEKI 2-like [Salvia hispanica]|uniref:protein SOSEKI 2-like n=1 Tax=Salvia hispanica TaxID=49212 RepID=UPI0020091B48|nr:protein SOSEKI 2-like [Salvia hispanica]
MCIEARMMRPSFKKVQIVYYLSRNGHLEHPHYMEVTHLFHQQLRLKDVIDRLTVLRGKAMPSLYSWSCKRIYKSGYVWNDLAQNDVIYPCEGAEYVLKGSELIEGTTEKLRHLQISKVPLINNQYDRDEEEEGYTSTITPRSRRSRGVSTDEFRPPKPEFLSVSSPPSTTSSSVSEKANNEVIGVEKGGAISKDVEDVGTEPLLSRNSMLLSLIACGGSVSFRKAAPPEAARRSGSGGLHKGVVNNVVCKSAVKHVVDVDVDEDVKMIGLMSENPRFGNLQSEEKEYFSGSIVETIPIEKVEGLKKSSSHNEEKSGMSGLGEAADEEQVQKKGKCIPMKRSCYRQPKK